MERLGGVLEASLGGVLERLGGVLKRLGALLEAIWPEAERVEKTVVSRAFWSRGRVLEESWSV